MLSFPAVAHAEGETPLSDAGGDVNRWRVHLELELATWLHMVPWPRVPGAAPGKDYLGGLAYRRAAFGFGLSHGFGDWIVAGLRFDYAISRDVVRTPVPADEPKAMEAGAMPFVEILLARKNIVRPFVMIRGGLSGGLISLDGRSPVEQPRASASMIAPSIGVGLGAHAFVGRDVSIDGLFTIDHRWEFMRMQGSEEALHLDGDLPPGAWQPTSGYAAAGRTFHFALGIGVSRWF